MATMLDRVTALEDKAQALNASEKVTYQLR